MSETIETSGAWTTLARLMHDPAAALADLGRGSMKGGATLAALALVCLAGYGAAGGLYQGGSQVALAAVKAPLIVAGSVLLCLPSLYVFAGLGGAVLDGGRLRVVISGLLGLIGLMLAALLPINWLFSVSSRSLGFLVSLHVLAWAVTLGFAAAFLLRVIPEPGARSGLVLWVLLVSIVSLQVTTMLRPVLWRAPGGPIVDRSRLSFFEHLDQVGKVPPAR
jgi:hypothetical protein